MWPVEADLGWQYKSPLDIFANRTNESVQTITDLRNILVESFKSTVFAQRLAQAR